MEVVLAALIGASATVAVAKIQVGARRDRAATRDALGALRAELDTGHDNKRAGELLAMIPTIANAVLHHVADDRRHLVPR